MSRFVKSSTISSGAFENNLLVRKSTITEIQYLGHTYNPLQSSRYLPDLNSSGIDIFVAEQ